MIWTFFFCHSFILAKSDLSLILLIRGLSEFQALFTDAEIYLMKITMMCMLWYIINVLHMLPSVKLWIKLFFQNITYDIENLLCMNRNISFQIQIYISNVIVLGKCIHYWNLFFCMSSRFLKILIFLSFHNFQSLFWSSLVMFSDYFSPRTIYITTHLYCMFCFTFFFLVFLLMIKWVIRI